jgi:hypothetical protein
LHPGGTEPGRLTVYARASVVIPAHNEASSLTHNLVALHDGAPSLDVVVVCNGCTDETSDLVRSTHPDVQVIDVPEPSKAGAIRIGNAATDVFPRIHLDADVRLSGASARALIEPLAENRFLATAPRRVLERDGCGLLVRWYYDVWERLPQVQSGLFGRGAIAVSAAGHARVSRLPGVLSDDLVLSEAFDPTERLVVDAAVVTVRPPQHLADLVRRRVRVVTGNSQADSLGLRNSGSTTSPADLVRLTLREPRLVPRIPVFLGVTLVARLLARRAVRARDFTTWHRDESSRRASAGRWAESDVAR